MRKSALPAIIFAYASAAPSSGTVSIMADTPLSALNRSVASPIAGGARQGTFKLPAPEYEIMLETSFGSGPTPRTIKTPPGRRPLKVSVTGLAARSRYQNDLGAAERLQSLGPLSPAFHTNLMWGQRFLQASLLTPLYNFDAESSPRGLPIRFQEVTPVRKPGKNATTQQKAAYREAKKTHNLSRAFVDMLVDLRQCFDSHGFADKELIAVGDGSFCNKTTFRQPLDRTILITRARKDLRLCFPYQGQDRRGQWRLKSNLGRMIT